MSHNIHITNTFHFFILYVNLSSREYSISDLVKFSLIKISYEIFWPFILEKFYCVKINVTHVNLKNWKNKLFFSIFESFYSKVQKAILTRITVKIQIYK